jgi:hypothetical protein
MDKQIEKEEMARIIAFELCPNRAIHKKWGEEAQCYSDNNFAECTQIKNVVDKLINAGYRKIHENAVFIEKTEYGKLVSLADECLDWRRKNCNVAELPKENAVVLTREETVDLFNSKASGFMTSAIGDIPLNIDGMRKLVSAIGDIPLNIDGMRKLVDEVSRLLIVQAELQELNAKYYNEAKDLRRKLNNDGAIYSRLELDGFIDKARKETAEKFAERLKELEEALLDMVVQFCQMGKEGELRHAFMSAEEQAFDVLNIKYGEKVNKVYKRFNKKWSRPIDEICKEFTEGEE